jgi:hypothetical protein
MPFPFILAATLAADPPSLGATRTSVRPVLDGRLDDAAWAAAPVTEAFTQKFPGEGKAPSHRTRMRVLYDDHAVYVAFECEQATTPIVARLTRRDRQVETDSVTIALDTRGDGKSAFEFSVSAAGVLTDGVRFNDTEGSNDWDETWDARTRVDGGTWTVEMEIPLRTLRFPTLSKQTWGLQARRYVSELQETDEWAFIPRAMAGEVSHYGKLVGMEGLVAKTPLELRPFVLGKVRHLGHSTERLATGTDAGLSAGLDLKWHPTQDLTLDAALNPDFAQVEADQIVLNLSTFETYYPEKRPFFLEGADTFATPIQVLYTRRIGRAAASPSLRTSAPFGEQLYDTPTPATIYGAEKLTGRVADGWTVGTLSALTARSDVTVQSADGNRSARLVAPTTSFQVARVKRDLDGNGHVGAIFTSTTGYEPTGTERPRDPGGSGGALCPSGDVVGRGDRCFHDAYVAGLDGRWRSPSGDYVAVAQGIASLVRGGPTRTLPDGTVLGSGDVGAGASVQVAKQGGEHWLWNLQYDYASRSLDYNDLGFMRRQNQHTGLLELGYRTLDPWWVTLETGARVSVTERENLDRLNLGRRAVAAQFIRFTNFWQLYHEVHGAPARFDDREVGDGAALERTWGAGYAIFVGTDPRKAISIGAYTDFDRNGNGSYWEGSFDLTVKPLSQLDFTLSPNGVLTHGEPRYVAAGPGPGDYTLGRLTAKNVGATLRATYTFTPRLTLQAFAQLFLASGHYDDFSIFTAAPGDSRPLIRLDQLRYGAAAPPTNPDFEQPALNANVVLRWEYAIGSTLFLVYSRAQVPSVTLAQGQSAALDLGAVKKSPATDVLLLKVSFFTPL